MNGQHGKTVAELDLFSRVEKRLKKQVYISVKQTYRKRTFMAYKQTNIHSH